jgi:hypothetical protein
MANLPAIDAGQWKLQPAAMQNLLPFQLPLCDKWMAVFPPSGIKTNASAG